MVTSGGVDAINNQKGYMECLQHVILIPIVPRSLMLYTMLILSVCSSLSVNSGAFRNVRFNFFIILFL